MLLLSYDAFQIDEGGSGTGDRPASFQKPPPEKLGRRRQPRGSNRYRHVTRYWAMPYSPVIDIINAHFTVKHVKHVTFHNSVPT